MAETSVQFYRYPQEMALSTFLPMLHPHLPHSNPLYNRILTPHNTPSRHCLFAATFPPESSQPPEIYTIIFSDRSRHSESQIWTFNPLITHSSLSPTHAALLTGHMQASILFLKNTHIPEAPGWPFSPLMKFACLHSHMYQSLVRLTEPKDAMPYMTEWNLWNIPTSSVSSRNKERRSLPAGFKVSRVPEDQLDVVISTSAIPRQPSTYLLLPNVGLLNEGKLVAWGYVGIDGAFATLFVQPDYRGKGFATYIATELMGRLSRGEFKDLGYDGRTGWAHSGVHEGNQGSEGVMRALGGTVGWKTYYVRVDSDKF